MNDQERATLESWYHDLAAALECEGLTIDLDAMLGLAGKAAHSVLRPAAPLTTFIVGYAAGRAAAGGTPPQDAVQEASDTALRLCAEAAGAER